ncbi:MAG: hypothetical protein AAGA34_08980 [Pseudomonadota bacterium]
MRVRIPFLDRIWRVKSSLKLDETLSVPEAFERLDTLLSAQGTDYTVDGNTLTYVKTNPAAQDKLATFTGGTLTVVPEEGATRLHYDVTSTALFLCFLAPLAFLAFGQFAYLVNEIEKPGIAAELEEEKKEEEQQAKDEQAIELHWIDKLLGAPTPKQPGEEDQEERARDGRDGDRDEDEVEGNHSPETAYVIAGIFALIYLVGRFLEPYLLKRTFRWALTRPDEVEDLEDNKEMEADAKFAPQGGGPSQT